MRAGILKERSGRWGSLLLLITVALVYFHHHPHTIQFGDSPELVGRAFSWTIPHPPGFPLYLWVLKPFLWLASPENVYSVASMVNITLSLMTLGILLLWPQNFLLVLSLAFSATYWQYSEIPEAFILNALFLVGILYLYLERKKSPLQKWHAPLVGFLFFTGWANHLTLVFAFPMVLHLAYENRRQWNFWIGSGLGVLTCLGLYLSLGIMHPLDLYSWGVLDNLPAIGAHFLRLDYGLFSLTGEGTRPDLFSNLSYFLRHSFQEFPSLFVFLGLGFLTLWKRRKRPSIETGVLSLSALLYIFVFFGLANGQLTEFMGENFKKFFISPLILLVGCATTLPPLSEWPLRGSLKKIMGGALVILGLLNFLQNNTDNNFSSNQIIQDYCLNFLKMANDKPTLAILDADTSIYGVQYVQRVFGIQPQVIPMSRWRANMIGYWDKIRHLAPQFQAPNFQIEPLNGLLTETVIIPNLSHLEFLVESNFFDRSRYHITVKALGRVLSAGTGIEFDPGSFEKIQRHNKTGEMGGLENEYNLFRQWEWLYSSYYLLKGQYEIETGDLTLARSDLLKSLQITPYCGECAKSYCRIEAQSPLCR